MSDNNKQGMGIGPFGSAAIGVGMGILDNATNLIFGKQLQKQQLEGQKKALQQQNEAQMDIWNRTNYGAQMEHLKNAGLNPGLLYGMGGAGGATTGSASAMPSSQGTRGMGIADAAQLSLLKAQKDNIEADTELKKANATKTAGVDTELGKGQIASLAQQTKNAEVQNELMQIDKRIRGMQEGILEATQYYEMGKVQEEWSKLVGEAKSAAARGQIDTATINEKIKQEGIRTAGMMIENRAREKGIELTDAQIDQIMNQMEVALKDAETGRWNAESNATNAGTNRMRYFQEVADASQLSVKEVTEIFEAIAMGAALGSTIKGKGKPNPSQRRQRYDKWGTKTGPGGYDLK